MVYWEELAGDLEMGSEPPEEPPAAITAATPPPMPAIPSAPIAAIALALMPVVAPLDAVAEAADRPQGTTVL